MKQTMLPSMLKKSFNKQGEVGRKARAQGNDGTAAPRDSLRLHRCWSGRAYMSGDYKKEITGAVAASSNKL